MADAVQQGAVISEHDADERDEDRDSDHANLAEGGGTEPAEIDLERAETGTHGDESGTREINTAQDFEEDEK